MAIAVISTPRGIPVSQSPNGLPVTVSTNGFGLGVTPVASGGMPVTETAGGLFGPVTIPVNTGPPLIIGTPQVGNTLLASSGTWGGSAASYTFQWKRGGVNIAGATTSSYLLVTADLAANITVTVTATNTAGSANATSAGVGPVTAGPVTLGVPTLSWESTPDINPPVLYISLPTGTLAGDHVVIQKSTDDVTWTAYANVTVVDPDAGSASGTAAALPTGAYILRPRMERGAAFSDWGIEVNINLIADVTAPTVVSYSPPDNSTSAAVNTELIVTFSETVILGASGTITLKKTSDNSTIKTWNVATDGGSTAGKVEVLNYNELHMHLSADLTGGVEYYVVWTAGVVRDGSGNSVAAQSSTTAWSFTAVVAFTWTPANASTAALWWVDVSNAATVTKTGTAPNEVVTQLSDLGTGAHNMTPTGGGPVYGVNAVNGLPGLVCAANSDLRTVAFTLPQPFMVVVVWKQTAILGDAYSLIWDGDRVSADGTRAQILNRFASTTYQVVAGGLVFDQGVTVAASTVYRSRVVYDGSSSKSTLNASSLNATTLGTGGITGGIRLGCSDPGNQPNVIICEAFLIPYANHAAAVASAPTDAANADAYVLAKWGV